MTWPATVGLLRSVCVFLAVLWHHNSEGFPVTFAFVLDFWRSSRKTVIHPSFFVFLKLLLAESEIISPFNFCCCWFNDVML